MNRLLFILTGVFSLFFFASAGIAAQEKLWVSSADAKLKADKTASAETIAELPVGTPLTVLSSDSKWYEVSTASGKKGWIYRGKVSNKPPAKSATAGASVGSALGELTGSGIRANRADTSRSIRGLSPEAEEYAKETGTPEECRKALDSILKSRTGNNETEAFLKQGNIGEYAR
ncbi:MAG: hypothetical protein BWK80_18170 [Desulfobacteraceae bacterium IS3]|nr:MAG: hypothetical protein BWK80_18170 [Desulfobacteraceae bacterium IS3]